MKAEMSLLHVLALLMHAQLAAARAMEKQNGKEK
jgi:hypothetical protein